MPKKSSDYEFRAQTMLSQKVSHEIEIIKKLAGSDPQISDSIAVLSYISDQENFKKSPVEFMLGLLDVLRLSHFATSENTNEITKMGFMLPRVDAVYFDE